MKILKEIPHEKFYNKNEKERGFKNMGSVMMIMGSEEVGRAFERYLRYVMGFERVFKGKLGEPSSLFLSLTKEMMGNINFWIIEAFSPDDFTNPEGFRTAEKLCDGKKRFLLIFYPYTLPEGFPEEGNFWITLPSKKRISQKIKEIEKYIPKKEEFENLKNKWKIFAYEPSHHHHRHSSIIEEKE